MATIPKIKKKVSSFLRNEDGKISKENLIRAGILISALTIGSVKVVQAVHNNALGIVTQDGTATATHNHHGSY